MSLPAPLDRLQRRLARAWHERAVTLKAASFAMVGVVNTLVDYGVFLAGYYLLKLPLLAAQVLAWVVAVSGSHVLNCYIIFAAESGRQLRWRAYAAFAASASRDSSPTRRSCCSRGCGCRSRWQSSSRSPEVSRSISPSPISSYLGRAQRQNGRPNDAGSDSLSLPCRRRMSPGRERAYARRRKLDRGTCDLQHAPRMFGDRRAPCRGPL